MIHVSEALKAIAVIEGLRGDQISETNQSVTLKNQDDEITLSREEILSMFGSGLSVMPEVLEEGLDPEMMGSLLEYLLNSQYDLGTNGESFATDMPETP